MLSEADRSHLARYEAFLALASEMIGQGDVDSVARLLDRRFKYVTRVHSWRYLCLGVAGSGGPSRQTDKDIEEPAIYLALWGESGQVHSATLAAHELTACEREAWRHGKARLIESREFDGRVDELPGQFRAADILQLSVSPLQAHGRLEALFFTSCRGAAFDALDSKFIALTAQFVHRKISHLRTEKRMTDELLGTLDSLRRTQDDLIDAEKLAALGSMVAGVSHEMNTPLANALLMATSLNEHLHGLETLVNSPSLRRSELLRWQGGAAEMGALLERAVQRAATLVASFKQVAVDQTSERRRVFDLRDCVEDVLAAVRPGLRKAPWELVNEVPPGIECDAFPGPLGQIVTNLVQNAVLHAFEGREGGRVTVSAQANGGQLDLSVSDDGIGINSANLVHIFEPFFTTKLGRGGSGLGLSICNRIATTILAGELRVISSPGSGTRFTLSMPQRTPRKL